MSLTTDLTAALGRISTPAKEVRDMLAILGASNDTDRDTTRDEILDYFLSKFATIYFVNEELGSDAAVGSVSAPFASIGKAVEECDADYSDDALYFVFVAPGNYVEDDILFAGHGLHLIGSGQPGRDSGVHVIGEVGAAYCVIGLAAANCEISNICFDAVGAEPVFYAPAINNCWIHDCVFHALGGATLDCMELIDVRNCIIERNKFFSFEEKGINLKTGGWFIESIIRDNFFAMSSTGNLGSGSKGIYIDAGCVTYGSLIENNKILMGEVGGSPIGIDNNNVKAGCVLITKNMVVVPDSKTPIESACSPDGILHNATQAGAVEVDPNSANG